MIKLQFPREKCIYRSLFDDTMEESSGIPGRISPPGLSTAEIIQKNRVKINTAAQLA
jgi:hypothetical protein